MYEITQEKAIAEYNDYVLRCIEECKEAVPFEIYNSWDNGAM